MLTRNHRQEALSRAYIHLIASACGLSTSSREFDYGVDLTLHSIRRQGRRLSEAGYKLDVQAKSTGPKNLTSQELDFDLPISNYNDLRDTTVGDYRILVVLVLPEKEADWITQTETELLLRRAAYWISLYGAPSSKNQRTIRISIPRSNLFTPIALQGIMEKVRNGDIL